MGRYLRSIFSFISESQRVYPDWDLLQKEIKLIGVYKFKCLGQKRLNWLGCTDSKEIKFCLGHAKCKGSINKTDTKQWDRSRRQIHKNFNVSGDGRHNDDPVH